MQTCRNNERDKIITNIWSLECLEFWRISEYWRAISITHKNTHWHTLLHIGTPSMQHFLEMFVVLHITSYNEDIYDLIQCSIALLWWKVQSRQLELLADVTTSWKQVLGVSIRRKKGHFENETTAKCWVVSRHVPTLQHKVKQLLISQKLLFVCFLKQLKKPYSVKSCC